MKRKLSKEGGASAQAFSVMADIEERGTSFRSKLGALALDFFRHAPLQVAFSLALTVALGLMEGAGLLMVVPFLQLVGLGEGAAPEGVISIAAEAFRITGVSASLPVVLGVFVGLVSILAAARAFHETLNARLTHEFVCLLRENLHRAMMKTQWVCFIRTRGSDIANTLTYDLQRAGVATQQLLFLVGTSIIALVHVGLAFAVSIPMTSLALGCGCGLLLLLRPFAGKAHQIGKGLQKGMKGLYGAINEHLGGMRLAKSYGVEEKHLADFHSLAGEIAGQFVRFARVTAVSRLLYQIGAAATLGVFLYLAVEVVRLSAMELLLLAFLFARLLPKFSMMMQGWQQVVNALPSFEAATRMQKNFELMAENFVSGAVPEIWLEKELRLEKVSFRYDGESVENTLCMRSV